MRQRLLDMAEQRNFLCDQLKALLKRNKVLEAEIYQLKNGGDLHSLSISMGSASFFRSHHSQKGHDDHSTMSHRYGKKPSAQHSQQPSNHPSKNQLSQQSTHSGHSSSKVRFDASSMKPFSNDGKHLPMDDDDGDNDPDPMLFLDEDDEDDDEGLAYLQQQVRTQKMRQTRQESGLRLSVSLDAEPSDNEGSPNDMDTPSRLTRRASSSRFAQLPAPLQRAAASGRGDSLFGVRPISSGSNMPNRSGSPTTTPLHNSHSAVGLGMLPLMAAPTSHGVGVSQSMPILPTVADAAKPTSVERQLPRALQSANSHKQHDQQYYKALYTEMVQNRPVLEVSLQTAIRDIFTEVRRRRKEATMLCSTKRSTGATFSGGGKNMPSSKSPSKQNPWAISNFHPNNSARGADQQGGHLSKGMQEILQELDAQEDYVEPEPGSDGARLIKMTPHITQRGGIAGLGTAQFTENDRFATMVKYLSQPEVFERVADRLFAKYFPPTEEEMRASGQYLGRRGRSPSPTAR